MNTAATSFVEEETYYDVLNCKKTTFYVIEIDVRIDEALIVWTDDNAEEWAYMNDMKRWIDVE